VRSLRYSPKAKDDLTSIAIYIATDNPQRAYSFVDEIEQRCQLIAKFPKAARRVNSIAGVVRVVSFKRYLVFYQDSHDAIDVLRVLHSARDIDSILEDPGEWD
jgi:toxin ParE1/3/4